ncbi:8-amino-7-oxononanoate synthase [Micromonospora sp. DT43]|uniref:8-amino-7-oxononanoate synthase n=1 Tax=Micromonospora sp. DT43 TaxID=3393440 RepID=UPI003CECE9BA
MADWLAALDRRAQLRAKAGLTRRLHPRPADDRMTDLAGNDYLGLATHPEVTAAATAALSAYGLGATGSRLVRGSTDAHEALENELAQWLGTDRALVFSSGYLANLGALRALVQPRTLLVSDAHNHASLIDGCRISGAETVVSAHADVTAVAAALAVAPGRPAVVVTESVFSVDGDLAPLADLHAVARRYGALLLVDDAHALGVTGPSGAGAVAAAGLAGEPDVVVTATLSKALGGAGGVVAGPAEFVRHLVETSRTFIFDTALPPAVAAGVHAALRLARAGDDLRAELADRVALAVGRLGAAGLAVSAPDAAVISVAAPGPEAATAWAADCRDRGVAVGCFRPPSTPDSRSRLRLTVSAGVSRSDFERALDVIVECGPVSARSEPVLRAPQSRTEATP